MSQIVEFFACAGNEAALPCQIANRTIEFQFCGIEVRTGCGDILLRPIQFSSHTCHLDRDLFGGLVLLVLYPSLKSSLALTQLSARTRIGSVESPFGNSQLLCQGLI